MDLKDRERMKVICLRAYIFYQKSNPVPGTHCSLLLTEGKRKFYGSIVWGWGQGGQHKITLNIISDMQTKHLILSLLSLPVDKIYLETGK